MVAARRWRRSDDGAAAAMAGARGRVDGRRRGEEEKTVALPEISLPLGVRRGVVCA